MCFNFNPIQFKSTSFASVLTKVLVLFKSMKMDMIPDVAFFSEAGVRQNEEKVLTTPLLQEGNAGNHYGSTFT